jgi:hypothetical protein
VFRRAWGPLCREFSAFSLVILDRVRRSRAEGRASSVGVVADAKFTGLRQFCAEAPNGSQARRSRIMKERARASGWLRRKHDWPASRGGVGSANQRRDGATWPRSLQMDWDADQLPPRACQLSASAPALTSGASRMSADRPKAIPEPSNPPSAPASPFERRFTAPPPQRPARGRQRTRGIPISPRGPTCSQPHMSRGTSSCPL